MLSITPHVVVVDANNDAKKTSNHDVINNATYPKGKRHG